MLNTNKLSLLNNDHKTTLTTCLGVNGQKRLKALHSFESIYAELKELLKSGSYNANRLADIDACIKVEDCLKAFASRSLSAGEKNLIQSAWGYYYYLQKDFKRAYDAVKGIQTMDYALLENCAILMEHLGMDSRKTRDKAQRTLIDDRLLQKFWGEVWLALLEANNMKKPVKDLMEFYYAD